MNLKCNKWSISIGREIEQLNTFKTNNCLKSDSDVGQICMTCMTDINISVFLVISGPLQIL